MSFVVLVPARLASTRLPRKPLADIGGLPMVVRVAQRAALSADHGQAAGGERRSGRVKIRKFDVKMNASA